MRIIVCGGRDYSNKDTIKHTMSWFCKPDDTIIHGGCRGADTLAGEVAEELGLTVEVYPADWKKHGKGAGLIRNQQMLDTGADFVMAFHENLAESKGTQDMINRANDAGLMVIFYE